MQARIIAVRLLTAAAVLCLGAQASAAPPPYATQATVSLAPSSPRLTAVDPFAVPVNAADPLKPARPFWYSVDSYGNAETPKSVSFSITAGQNFAFSGADQTFVVPSGKVEPDPGEQLTEVAPSTASLAVGLV